MVCDRRLDRPDPPKFCARRALGGRATGPANRAGHSPKESSMLTSTQRVMVAVADDEARASLAENLKADGYEPLEARTLGHARSRLLDEVDALLLDLGSETVELIDLIRGGDCRVPMPAFRLSAPPPARTCVTRSGSLIAALTTSSTSLGSTSRRELG
jgi:hypothetical protein